MSRSHGSSPRAWGTGGDAFELRNDGRFIPTSVGNGCPKLMFPRVHAVHPHERGERAMSRRAGIGTIGSSPRAWGTGYTWLCSGQFGRFIPTSVGNGVRAEYDRIDESVHPHERGERFPAPGKTRQPGGSSPRAWGTVHLGCGNDAGVRFIPTSVGNGPRTCPTRSMTPVHPHERGERLRPQLAVHVSVGSSPRAWGTARPDPSKAHVLRFIPTSVGNGQHWLSPSP